MAKKGDFQYSDDELLSFVGDLFLKHGPLSLPKYNRLKHTLMSGNGLVKRFGSWTQLKNRVYVFMEEREKCNLERAMNEKKIAELYTEIKRLKTERVTAEEIRQYLFGLSNEIPIIPEWTVLDRGKTPGVSGIPCFQMSDWHWSEVVKPEQVFGKNEYNIEIAKERVRIMVEHLIDLLFNHFVHPSYPGLVALLNGDFISGTIHQELIATNEFPIMPSVLSVYGTLIWTFEQLLQRFKKIAVFATPGNHSRTTNKPFSKDNVFLSYDWLIYQMLEKWFRKNDNISFIIAPGEDQQFKVYSHRYRMTHGGQFRGGTGFIGPYAPITRGEIKKRSAAETYGMNYDTLIIGHFHQLMQLDRVVVNGSLIGYNQFALHHQFPFAPPKQALWLTHPKWGKTIDAPVFCTEDNTKDESHEWVSWFLEEQKETQKWVD